MRDQDGIKETLSVTIELAMEAMIHTWGGAMLVVPALPALKPLVKGVF